jgi:predicted metal-binding membrane protein
MITALRTERDSWFYGVAIGALIVLAWAVLAWLGPLPHGGHLPAPPPALRDRGPAAAQGAHSLFHGDLHRPVQGPLQAGAHLGLFIVGWTLMTIAMMLPTSLPLVTLFHAAVRRRPDRTALLAALITGYLAAWLAFGVIVHVLESVLHTVIGGVSVLATNTGYLSVAVLTLAGVYQFTPLKERCLAACRSPMTFLVQHWRGRSSLSRAAHLGVRHGVFCVGCCWSLMLVMLAVGGVHLGWMLALGAVMAVEKSAPWGRRLVAPAGVVLVAAAAMLAVRIITGAAL